MSEHSLTNLTCSTLPVDAVFQASAILLCGSAWLEAINMILCLLLYR